MRAIRLLILASSLLLFGDIHCPLDPFAICHNTGQTYYHEGRSFQIWDCSCGHKVYVAN